jgi:hypothetical protein
LKMCPAIPKLSGRLNQIKEAATNFLLTDAKSEVDILHYAKANQLDPFNVLPELNIRIHIYTIFIYDKILLREEDTVENVWQEFNVNTRSRSFGLYRQTGS